jgi:integrase/recombinase XerD
VSDTTTLSPLRQHMIGDMAARKLNPHTPRSHVHGCQRFAAWLKRSPDTATPDEVCRFQLYLIESSMSICNRNRIMTGVRFLFRVTLRRLDLVAEAWHIKEPERLAPVRSPEEVRRVPTIATSLKARTMLSLAYGCGPARWCGCERGTSTTSRGSSASCSRWATNDRLSQSAEKEPITRSGRSVP